jgi:hypothetical protein
MTAQTYHSRYVELTAEAATMRNRIRAAADTGDAAEVARLLGRVRELEDELLAVRLTDVRHSRKSNPRQYVGGYNPGLEEVEHELSQRLAKIGQRHHLH